MTDQVASLLPPGAGRFLDFLYPDPTIAATGISSAMRGRNNVAQLAGTILNIGAGGGQLTAVVNGLPVQQLTCSAGNGNQRLFYPGFPMMLRTSRSKIGPYCDDCSVYRFIWTVAAQGIAVAANRDYGLEFTRFAGAGGGTSRLVADNAPGIGLRLQAANQLDLLVNGPNGIVVTNITPAGYNSNLVFHTFDLRFFSATETVDAFWTLRIDGSPIALSAINSSWGAVGTNLPPVTGVGGAASTSTTGFIPSIVNDSNNANGMFVHQLRLIAAPSELMTL